MILRIFFSGTIGETIDGSGSNFSYLGRKKE
jgi:hypothetical protein